MAAIARTDGAFGNRALTVVKGSVTFVGSVLPAFHTAFRGTKHLFS
jgi:hypothetical protein